MAAAGKIFFTGVALSLFRSRLADVVVLPQVRGRQSKLVELHCTATAGSKGRLVTETRGRARAQTTVTELGCGCSGSTAAAVLPWEQSPLEMAASQEHGRGL